MASLTDILSATQNGVIAANNLVIQIGGSLRNINAQFTTLTTNVTANTTNITALNGTLSQASKLVNGGMEIDQEHAGAAVTVGAATYVVDGWQVQKVGTMVCTAQQVADAPPGFTNSIKITVGTAEVALGAGDYTAIVQPVEGFRTSCLGFGVAGAQTITLGFWTKIHRVGAYSGSIRNAATTRGYAFSFTQLVSDTWEYKTVTIPGDITGAWVGNTNATSMYVTFTMASGVSFTGAANTWVAANVIGVNGTTNGVGLTSDIFQTTGVTLIGGAFTITAAQSPLLKRSVDQEMPLCKRYFYNGIPPLRGVVSSSLGTSRLAARHPVTLRSSPALSILSSIPLPLFDGSVVATISSAGIVNNYSTVDLLEIDSTSSAGSGLTLGRPAIVYQASIGNINVDARLT